MKMSPLSIHSKLLSALAIIRTNLLLIIIFDLWYAYFALRITIFEDYWKDCVLIWALLDEIYRFKSGLVCLFTAAACASLSLLSSRADEASSCSASPAFPVSSHAGMDCRLAAVESLL